MYRYTDITELHIEISSYCQAECPQCIRTHNPLLNENNISFDFYKKTFEF